MPQQTRSKSTSGKTVTAKRKAASKAAKTPPQAKATAKKTAVKAKARAKRPTSASARTGRAKAGRPDPPRLQAILALLEELYPRPTTALSHRSALELLVATILSAQCTDERVNQVTPELFRVYPDAAALASAPLESLEQLIHSTGFFRAKARSIKGACAAIAGEHQGEVPRSMEEMVKLPGVARKTANVVLGTAYGIPSGVVVDTHVKRVSGRLGLTQHTEPVKIEQDLMELIPQERWIDLGHQLILHGRALCQARKPKCEQCPLAPHCPSATTGG